ncbi:hypothetical protein NL676_011436 [Syzygium grande]|nr:hypothetical protein NL676_011436 [Syzygium grande]
MCKLLLAFLGFGYVGYSFIFGFRFRGAKRGRHHRNATIPNSGFHAPRHPSGNRLFSVLPGAKAALDTCNGQLRPPLTRRGLGFTKANRSFPLSSPPFPTQHSGKGVDDDPRCLCRPAKVAANPYGRQSPSQVLDPHLSLLPFSRPVGARQ